MHRIILALFLFCTVAWNAAAESNAQRLMTEPGTWRGELVVEKHYKPAENALLRIVHAVIRMLGLPDTVPSGGSGTVSSKATITVKKEGEWMTLAIIPESAKPKAEENAVIYQFTEDPQVLRFKLDKKTTKTGSYEVDEKGQVKVGLTLEKRKLIPEFHARMLIADLDQDTIRFISALSSKKKNAAEERLLETWTFTGTQAK